MMKKARKSPADAIMLLLVYVFLLLLTAIALYPLVYTLSMSISGPTHVARNDILLFPRGFSLQAFKLAFEDRDIWRSYGNTLWYTVTGTALSLVATVVSAYPLSRRHFFLRRPLMKFIVFTMYFSGGMVPQFILINNLGLYNTRWACILPYLISAYNLIVCRSFFESIPDAMEEAAIIDGASQYTILLRIFVPLSMPILAVLTLFYAVGQWNGYFSAMMYLPNTALHPVQMYLRKVLVLADTESAMGRSSMGGFERSIATQQLKYAVIVITAVPILALYPFLQKYFVKGVMIGSVKG